MPQVTESKEPAFEKTVRIWPYKMHGEGHYLALLQKGEKSEKLVVKEKKKRALSCANDKTFIKEKLSALPKKSITYPISDNGNKRTLR